MILQAILTIIGLLCAVLLARYELKISFRRALLAGVVGTVIGWLTLYLLVNKPSSNLVDMGFWGGLVLSVLAAATILRWGTGKRFAATIAMSVLCGLVFAVVASVSYGIVHFTTEGLDQWGISYRECAGCQQHSLDAAKDWAKHHGDMLPSRKEWKSAVREITKADQASLYFGHGGMAKGFEWLLNSRVNLKF